MKKIVIFNIIFLLFFPFIGLCEQTIDHAFFLWQPTGEQTALSFSTAGFEIRSSPVNRSTQNELYFIATIKNHSPHHKYDIQGPFDVRLTDEFGNIYSELDAQSSCLGKEEQTISLYPGEGINFACRFQTPVPLAERIFVAVADYHQTLQADDVVFTKDITGWNDRIAKAPGVSSDDLIIVYPAEKRVFAPGDTVFLKVDFSAQAGRPRNLHVVLPDYVLTDDQVKGQYELKVSSDREDGPMEVIVLAEWGEPPSVSVVSKTLFLNIKG